MATLAKLKVFENGGMIQFATLTDELITSEPKGTVRIKKSGDGFSFEKVETGASIAAVADFADVLDSAGAAYGADFDAVLTALSFFFEVAGGGGGGGFDWQYAPASWQAFTASVPAFTTVTGLTNSLIGYYIQVLSEVTISQLQMRCFSAAAGKSVFGVYALNEAFYPSTLIFQTAENDNALLTPQITTGLSQVLPAGYYFVASNTNSTASFYALTAASVYISLLGVFEQINTVGWRSGLYKASVTYSSVMPATFPAGASLTGNTSMPILTFKLAG